MRVLVVDDDADMVEVLVLSLVTCQGWDVQAVTTGLRALEICWSQELDAVLLDVDMPIMDGPGVLAALRADARTVRLPVVFVTALADPVFTSRLSMLGAAGVLPKPFDPLRIGEQVAGFLGWQSLPPGPVDLRAGRGQRHFEDAAPAGGGPRRDPSTVRFDDPASDRETEPSAAGPALTGDVELDERLEDLVELPLRDAGAVIADLELGSFVVDPAGDGDRFPLR